MKKTSFYLTLREREEILRMAEQKNITSSALVRLAIDLFLSERRATAEPVTVN